MTISDIKHLTVDERLALISQLWDSLDEGGVDLTLEQAAELNNRLASFDRDMIHAVSWGDLKAALSKEAS
jgi:putative addiction module component (TIGR02574 family)